MGRGGAYVPARVALQGRIRRSIPAHHACIFGMETPLHGRSGGHTGTAPTVSLERIARGCPPLRILLERIAHGYPSLRFHLGRLCMDGWFRLGKIVRGCITEMVGMNHRGGRVGACAYSTKPMALAFFMSKAMSGSRSLGTLLSSTASFRVCFNWPTSRHGPR